MNISKIRINEQLGWIKGLPRVISLFIRSSSSGINRFSIVLYPHWPASTVFINLFPQNSSLFLPICIPSPSFFLPSQLSLRFPFLSMNYTTRPILWIVPPLPSSTIQPLPICTPCARVYRYAPRWIALSLDHVNWTRVNYRDVSKRYFHSNGGGLTRSWQTRSLIISWQSRKSHVREYPQVRMLSSN